MPDSVYLGKRIGNYQVVKEIARGAFGSVFLAQHLFLKQRTAVIKFLHAVRLESSIEQEQFLQEAQILDMLKGMPYVLPLLDVSIDGDIPYLIAEYAEQGSLRARIKRSAGSPLPLQEALTILAQVGQALQGAHDKNIVHRDLKPENILFNARGEALLADFGISMVLSTTSLKFAEAAGTPAYMAPEQFKGVVSKESDQYSLACIAYELLTGRQLFTAPDFIALAFLHTTETPVSPRLYNPQLPVSIELTILKALAKNRSERYASVSEFINTMCQPPTPQIYHTLSEDQAQSTFLNTPPAGQQDFLQTYISPIQSEKRASYAQPDLSYQNPANPYSVQSQPSQLSTPQIPMPTPPAVYPAYNPVQYQQQAYVNHPAQNFQQPLAPEQLQSSSSIFYRKTGAIHLLAGLIYLTGPIIVVPLLLYFIWGNKNRFVRFHARLAVYFFTLAIAIIFALAIVDIIAGSGSIIYEISTNVATALIIICIFLWPILIIVALLGKYFKIPFMYKRALTFADRKRAPLPV